MKYHVADTTNGIFETFDSESEAREAYEMHVFEGILIGLSHGFSAAESESEARKFYHLIETQD